MDDNTRTPDRTPDLLALHRLAYAQDGLFTSRQARRLAISMQLLAHHTRSGRFERIRRGLYRLAGYPAGEHAQIRAAWLAVGEHRAVVSHESALVLHGLLHEPPNTTHLLVAREHRGLRPPACVTLHTAIKPIPDEDLTTRHGMRVSVAARAIVDSAGAGAASERIHVALTEALRRRVLTPEQLVEHAERHGGQAAALVGCVV
jgi:predicted transcriptional regulator of viral defense system